MPLLASLLLRLAIATATSFAGGLVCFALLLVQGVSHDVGALVAVAALGAGAAGLLLAGMFGHDRPHGVARAIAASVLATLIGAALAGTVFMPGIGTVVAALTTYVSVLTQPIVTAVWGLAMAGVHLTAVILRHGLRPTPT